MWWLHLKAIPSCPGPGHHRISRFRGVLDSQHSETERGGDRSYLARVDSLSREGIVVGTHLVAVGVLGRQGDVVVDRGFGDGKS